jgi:23S rRNA (uracil1939-C5)-methyltransferase
MFQADPLKLVVTGFDNEARGVARHEGKVVFVEGALIGETVIARPVRSRPSYDIAALQQVIKPSALRVTPRCPSFGVCGGCSMQHLDAAAQVSAKQRLLEDSFLHIAKLKPELMLRPIHGPAWRYRYRARLAVRYVQKKGAVLVGFHEKRSSFVADMQSCEVLPAHVSALLPALRELVGKLSIRDRLPQFELAVGDHSTVLVARVLEPPSRADEELLRQFAVEHSISFWLQPKGPDSAVPFFPTDSALGYRLPEFGVEMPFRPTDFTQVNQFINRTLVTRALRLLDVKADERVADLFCGLGNFTLPIATLAKQVVGFEGSASLTQRAKENARRNQLDAKVRFETVNLFDLSQPQQSALSGFDKMLIDPPREGALEVVRSIIQPGFARPTRIVYVSCNPSTLARDAALLVHQGGYALRAAGVVNMFPHTSHVESIAVFETGSQAD